jgi:hypothetical protein
MDTVIIKLNQHATHNLYKLSLNHNSDNNTKHNDLCLIDRSQLNAEEKKDLVVKDIQNLIVKNKNKNDFLSNLKSNNIKLILIIEIPPSNIKPNEYNEQRILQTKQNYINKICEYLECEKLNSVYLKEFYNNDKHDISNHITYHPLNEDTPTFLYDELIQEFKNTPNIDQKSYIIFAKNKTNIKKINIINDHNNDFWDMLKYSYNDLMEIKKGGDIKEFKQYCKKHFQNNTILKYYANNKYEAKRYNNTIKIYSNN